MSSSQYDVIVVGAGAAGVTAAIGLARAGFSVAVLEAAPFPGAENWSGCVYFCENLAEDDILGRAGLDELAWERRLVERGFFGTDGHGLLGMSYRDPGAFRGCYTVLRPVFDHHLAQVARKHGVALLCETTAESLIRERGRIIGVCTQRGALYADLVFLAEGDASHLVTREGYERYTDQRDAPKFLQGIKQVIDMPPGAIEEIFKVGPEEGVAYEMLLRNGTLRGQPVHLNAGGFLYTNKQSLSIGLVLPADNLHDGFDGDPNLLMEWFANLPALKPWLDKGTRGVFGAKIIRGGGLKDVPNLIDDGLAIGGAASAIGIDFPYPNFTGPATFMGRLIVQAAKQVRAAGGRYSRDQLRKHYLEPLQQSHYWQDVSFLRSWPGYVKKTEFFFGRNLDLALGSAYIWTRPNSWLPTKWTNWLRLVLEVAGPGQWPPIQRDLRHLTRALRVKEVADRPSLGRLLLDGTVNALRDLFGKPRVNVPAAGEMKVHYSTAGGAEPSGPPPRVLRRWFERFHPVLASAAQRIYRNDDMPLQHKLPTAIRLLTRQVNMLDLILGGFIALGAFVSAWALVAWDWLRRRVMRVFRRGPSNALYPRYAQAARQAIDLTPHVSPAARNWEAQLSNLAYDTVKDSHIQVLWPQELEKKNEIAAAGLWHVCPAHVYEARMSPLGQLQVVVNFENCIKCETCWRTDDRVTWGRDGQHRFIYALGSPALPRLLDGVNNASLARPALPFAVDPWDAARRALAGKLPAGWHASGNGRRHEFLDELYLLLDQIEDKLIEFDLTLAEEPRTVNRDRAEFLETLARYAQQLAARFVEEVRASELADQPECSEAFQQIFDLAQALAAKAEERARRTWTQHYAWAAADGRQLRFHHLDGLRQLLSALGTRSLRPSEQRSTAWLRSEHDRQSIDATLADWRQRLDDTFPANAWRALEHGEPLEETQDKLLRELIASIPVVDGDKLADTLHPPLRKALLAELGRRDPSLAYRVAVHLWARDLAGLSATSGPLAEAAQRWAAGEEWAAYTTADAVAVSEGRWKGEALFVPARQAQAVLMLVRDQLVLIDLGQETPGFKVEPLASLGLRGAGLARIRLDGLELPAGKLAVDPERIRRIAGVISSADLIAIAAGMAEILCRRAIDHASARVQFPGLFHDEEARDAIGKFGAIKKMIAEMEARRYLIDTLAHALTPTDLSSTSRARALLMKALTAEALGTAPGSLSYNAGQVFGGTGYSEDDILSKYYRDASAWRFLGVSNSEVLQAHGQDMLVGYRKEAPKLAGVPGEIELFDQVAQRKALQGELDEIRNLRSRLRGVCELAVHKRGEAGVDSETPAEAAEALARQDAHLLASKALLFRTHARFEHGYDAQIETALLRVWLDDVAVSLEQFDVTMQRWLEPAPARDDRPLVDPAAGPPVLTYRDYLDDATAYDSGDFVRQPVDLARPRFVPELIATDEHLSGADARLREQLIEFFGSPRGDNESYERYVERRHRPDAADLDFLRKHGFFRYPIPKDMGGEAKSKAEYYLLTTNVHRFADVTLSLTIQVNSSLGTTPVLIARDKDLPKAQKELEAFVGETSVHRSVEHQLQDVVALLERANPDAKRIEAAYRKLQQLLKEKVLGPAVLRVVFGKFSSAWGKAGRAGQAYDLVGMKESLKKALLAWKAGLVKAGEYREELSRRRDTCDLFLRWVASGQISAFALTEPSAGSDTARVATRARLHSAPVEKEDDGVLRFVPVGDKEPCYVLDARKLEFGGEGVFYRYSADAEPARINFDEYDYETDDPSKQRYYLHGGRRIDFSDVAQLRERDGQLFYDYWELNGAKMWITNGRMCGIMCLYAKTDEGVTGFIVDRHAAGLSVGKDEDKMGQCGSPTNELSLQGVRVPRENVIGLEGRGQVNALETLNVGRAGIAMSSMSQMKGLIDFSRSYTRARHGDIPGWIAWRLARMEELRFVIESIAYETIGRFEHKRTKSVRFESAIAKMLGSESLHRMIELSEEIHDLDGQTQRHLVEKRKRDARVLNIYEGTNEIQRFFILKDLPGLLKQDKQEEGTARPPLSVGRDVLELETHKVKLREQATAALKLFRDELWQNPSLQANCFLLSEATAWLKAADSVLARLAWLERYELREALGGEAASASDSSPRLLDPRSVEIGRRALAYCLSELRDRIRRFDDELTHLRRGHYAPSIRAASLLFRHSAEEMESRWRPRARVATRERPALPAEPGLRVLVVLEPAPYSLPHLHVSQGRLLEPHLSLSPADQAALEAALQLRDHAPGRVVIEVAGVGPRGAASALREAISRGVDRVRLLVPPDENVSIDSAAQALASLLQPSMPFDLILGGSSGGDEEGLLAALTAQYLGVPGARPASKLSVREGSVRLESDDSAKPRVRALPRAVPVQPGLELRSYSIEGYLTGLGQAVEVLRWPRRMPVRSVKLSASAQAASGPSEEAPLPLAPREAAHRLLGQLGIGAGQGGTALPLESSAAPNIEDVAQPELAGRVVAVVAAEPDGRLAGTASTVVRAGRLVAASQATSLTVLLLVSSDEVSQQRALAELLEWHRGDVVLLAVPDEQAAGEVRARLLVDCWSLLAPGGEAKNRLASVEPDPFTLVGAAWTEPAFAALACRDHADLIALRVRRVSRDRFTGRVVLETSRVKGKLHLRQNLPDEIDAWRWITLTGECEIEDNWTPERRTLGRVQRWTPRLDRFLRRADIKALLEELKQETGVLRLSDADFIVDVGFGVGNRDGFEAVIDPLVSALRQIGVKNLIVGGTRKVTEELHLLPVDRQIGQSGTNVNPRIMLAIGVSGAPQHLNYIGPRATILSFNRDPEAPLMTLNQRQPRPRVFPIIGNLFETVPALTKALLEHAAGEAAPEGTAGARGVSMPR